MGKVGQADKFRYNKSH